MELKLTRLINRYSQPCMWIAGICTAAGIVFHHVIPLPLLAAPLFCMGAMLAGFPILYRAVQGLRFKTIGIECLVSIAVVGAFVIGELSEAGIVTFLFQFGSWLEQKTMKKTRSAIKALTELAPSTAWRIDGENWEEIDVDEVEEGDLLLVKTGGQISVDGTVTKGEGYVNEASITGEALPQLKQPGDSLYAGTILDSGTLQMEADRVGEDTTFARIIELVEEAQDAKSPAERFIDRFAKYYTPAVVVMAVLVYLILRNLDTAITVLVLACPGALVIGAPIANVAGIGRGAQAGILLKGGDSVHTFVKTDTVVFDKTGTLTQGQPEVIKLYCYCDDEQEALMLAASAELAADHPLGYAVLRYVDERGIEVPKPEKAEPIKGMGIRAEVAGRTVLVGSLRLMQEFGVVLPTGLSEDMKACQDSSLILVGVDGRIALLLAVADRVKPDAEESIRSLKALGVRHVVMLTGDHVGTAHAVAKQIGIDEVHAELLPQDKLEIIRDMQANHRVVTFVGDGINDSPAITAADTGIAMGTGTDAAIDCSDVVLIRSDLTSAALALQLAKKTVAVMYENIAIALGTVIFLLIGLFAGYIHMAVGMLVHEASILAVILNAMRILGYRPDPMSLT